MRQQLISLLVLMCLSLTAYAHTESSDQKVGLIVYKVLLKSAYKGDPEVQTALGRMRLQGKVVDRDLKLARQWFGRAALQNYAPAQYDLGKLLLWDVLGASSNQQYQQQMIEGLHWLRQAARQNNQDAQILYAEVVLNTPDDQLYGHSKDEALNLLKTCAYEKNAPCIAKTLVLNTDESTERDMLTMQANLDNPKAMMKLAQQVINNETALQVEDPSLLSLVETAARAGEPQAMYQMGRWLVEGTRYPLNMPKGIQWLQLAAQAGHAEAQQLLSPLLPKQNKEREAHE